METAVIYLRVSTDSQTEESQRIPCEEFCKDKGYEVIGVFKDHAKSAYKNIKRPAYDEIKNIVKKRKVQHVVVWAIDRWTRRGHAELKDSVVYLSTYGAQLHAVKEQWIENINLPGSMGELVRDFFFGMAAWMAEAEAERLSDRVKGSLKFQKAKEKGTVGRSTLPTSIINEVLGKLDEGKSYRAIHSEVSYKAKHGKIKFVSVGKIAEIAKNRSEKGKKKLTKKNTQKSM